MNKYYKKHSGNAKVSQNYVILKLSVKFHPVVQFLCQVLSLKCLVIRFSIQIYVNPSLAAEVVDSGREVVIDGSLLGVRPVLRVRRCNGDQSIGKGNSIGLKGLEVTLDERNKIIGFKLALLVL